MQNCPLGQAVAGQFVTVEATHCPTPRSSVSTLQKQFCPLGQLVTVLPATSLQTLAPGGQSAPLLHTLPANGGGQFVPPSSRAWLPESSASVKVGPPYGPSGASTGLPLMMSPDSLHRHVWPLGQLLTVLPPLSLQRVPAGQSRATAHVGLQKQVTPAGHVVVTT